MGEIRGGVTCWRTEAAISLKRVKIEEKLLWRAYSKSQTLFRTVQSPTPTASRSPRFGVHNPIPKLAAITIISRTTKAIRTANLADTFTGSIRTQAREKCWKKGSVGVSKECPIFEYPYYLMNGYSYELQIVYAHSQDRLEEKSVKNFVKSSRERTQRLSKIFRVPICRAHRAVILR